jgi:hypothetical protein
MARIDNADVIVGTGITAIAAGAYKDAEGKTRYKFGIMLDIPKLEGELFDKVYNVGLHRVMSVAAAGTFNKEADYGTKADAEAFAEQFSTVEGWEKAFEKAKREGVGAARVDTTASLAIRILMKVLRTKHEKAQIAAAAVAVPRASDPPKTEKGQINFNAWAKLLKEANHPWYDRALKDAKRTEETKGFD